MTRSRFRKLMHLHLRQRAIKKSLDALMRRGHNPVDENQDLGRMRRHSAETFIIIYSDSIRRFAAF